MSSSLHAAAMPSRPFATEVDADIADGLAASSHSQGTPDGAGHGQLPPSEAALREPKQSELALEQESASAASRSGTRAPSIRPPAGFFAPKKPQQQHMPSRPASDAPAVPDKRDATATTSSSAARREPSTGLTGLSTMSRTQNEHSWPTRHAHMPSQSTDGAHARNLSSSTRTDKPSLATRASNDPLLLTSRQSSLRGKSQNDARRGDAAHKEKDALTRASSSRPSAVQRSQSKAQSAKGTAVLPNADGPTKKRQRRYQAHRGGNKFLLGGRIMTSDDNLLAFLGSLTVMIAVPVLWLIFDAPYVWRQISPAPVVLFAYLYLIALSSMLVTSLRDPGILPRNLDTDPPCTAGEGTGYVPSSDPLAIPVPRVIRVRHGTDLKVKWCETCQTYRPPRSSHCRVCDNCVENIDHHCTFLNTCIGRRNYCTFIAFLVASIMASFFATVFSALHLYYLTRPATSENGGAPRTFQSALAKSPMSAVLFLLSLGAAGPLVTLLSYHVRLVGMNRTTVEQIRINATKLYSEKPEYDDRMDRSSDLADKGEGADCSHATRSRLCCCCGCGVLGQPGRDPNPFAYRTVWRNARAALCRPMAVESWIRPTEYIHQETRQENPATTK